MKVTGVWVDELLLIKAARGMVLSQQFLENGEHKIALDIVLDTYRVEIAIIGLVILIAILFSVFTNIYVSNKLKEQNNKYEILSQISNEYLYEYFPRTQRLILADKFYTLFYTQQSINEAVDMLKSVLSNQVANNSNILINLRLPGGELGAFKAVNLYIYDGRGRVESIMGKLIDVSEETAEKEKLLEKAQVDGLTGLYNADTTQELIDEWVKKKENNLTDAFILLDCDGFKKINDTYGHLAGNQVLKDLADIIKKTFRSTDILGRVGGDEFCLYLKNVQSVSYVQERCRALSEVIDNTIQGKDISVSMGIVMVLIRESYESLFKKADAALYQAKNMGKAQYVFFDESQYIPNTHHLPNNQCRI